MAKPSIGFQALRRIIKALGDYRLSSARRRHGAGDGDFARHHNHWPEAVAHYERYLARFPHDVGIRARLANTWREAGDTEAAIEVLREAILLRPEKTRLHSLLAEILDEAGYSGQVAETVAIGASVSGPYGGLQAPAPPQSGWPLLSSLRAGDAEVQLVIDAGSGSEDQLFETLESVVQSSMGNWRATVVGEGNVERDPRIDSRIHFHDAAVSPSDGEIPSIRLDAGVLLYPHCLGWLLWGMEQGADIVYCDHMVTSDKGGGSNEVVLQAAPHPLDLWTNPKPPRIILFRVSEVRDEGAPGDALISAFGSSAVMHVPLVLGAAPDVKPVLPGPVLATALKVDSQRILVVIPTRNEGAALEVMLRSLIDHAALESSLDVVIVDNGSDEIATIRVLNEWSSSGRAHVLRHDAAFNWSRLNNLACEGRDQPLIVFANNDMEMLSPGWDDHVRNLLGQDGVGVIGARLLYPNDRVQHAGIVMSALNGEPLHEGLRVSPDDRGPLDRWVRRRPATAVTGAFMAVRREVFDQLGGFDAEAFAVSCNDVDFCLRAGAVGWTVLYAPELLLRHHESLSRGHSNTEAKQQRAAQEMSRLLTRWGERAAYDPTRNPQWKGRGIRLFAGHCALTGEQAKDWALKTMSQPQPPALSRQGSTPTDR